MAKAAKKTRHPRPVRHAGARRARAGQIRWTPLPPGGRRRGRLYRAPYRGAGGARAGAPAPRHVYRRHRREGAASPVRRGDRQRHGRGARRPCRFHQGRDGGRRLHHRDRQRPRHPGRSASEVQEQVRARSDHDARCTRAGNSIPRSTSTSGGLHGVGVSVANALSERMEVEVARGGQLYAQAFVRGKPKGGLQKLGKVNNRRGTKVRFKPDPEIFGAKAAFNPLRVFKMTRAKAYLFGGVEIRWQCDPRAAERRRCAGGSDLPFREGAGGLSQGHHQRLDAGASRHFRRQVGKEGRPRHGRMGGRFRRRRRSVPVVLLQHHPDARRRHP